MKITSSCGAKLYFSFFFFFFCWKYEFLSPLSFFLFPHFQIELFLSFLFHLHLPSPMVGHQRPWKLSITDVPPTSPVTINHRRNPQISKFPTHHQNLLPLLPSTAATTGRRWWPTNHMYRFSLSLSLSYSHTTQRHGLRWLSVDEGRGEEERGRKRERFVW